MSLLAKIFVVVVAVLSFLFLGVQSTLYYHSTDWREAFDRLRERHRRIVEEKDAVIESRESAIKDLEKKKAEVESSLIQVRQVNKATEDKLADKNNEFLKLRGDYESLQSTNKTIVSTIEEKDKSIKDYLGRITQLEESLKTALSDKETAEAQVARLISQKTSLEKDLAEVRKSYTDTKQKLIDMQLVMEELERQGVPVGTLVINHKPVPPIHGKVAGVRSDIQPALVLLTVGKDDNVEKGFQFSVYRGTEFIGKVVVEKVMADSCGCRVLFTAPGKVIKQGDDCATRLD